VPPKVPDDGLAPVREGRRPLVSVCLPVSRAPEVTRRALDSILRQDLDDFEVLIGDETGDSAVEVAAANDPRVDYRRNPVRLGAARNHVALLDRARGAYHAVLHDDDWWEPTYLSALVGALEADPAVGVACCDTVRDVPGGPPSAWPVPLIPGRNDDVLELLVREEWALLPTSAVWRREVWQGPAREWPDDLCTADLQLFLAAAEAGWAFTYVPRALAHWVQHTGQSGTQRGGDFGLTAASDAVEFWDRWLAGRPRRFRELSAHQRATSQLRRARALLLAGQRVRARAALDEAVALAGRDLAGRRRLAVAAALPTPALQVAVEAKRVGQRLLDRRSR
jgi:glycosyltransferase involved in cell wall biosynthesis